MLMMGQVRKCLHSGWALQLLGIETARYELVKVIEIHWRNIFALLSEDHQGNHLLHNLPFIELISQSREHRFSRLPQS